MFKKLKQSISKCVFDIHICSRPNEKQGKNLKYCWRTNSAMISRGMESLRPYYQALLATVDATKTNFAAFELLLKDKLHRRLLVVQ
eukprot:1312086-Amphidinium_carterae.1